MLPRRQRLSRAGFEGVRSYTRQTTPHFGVSFTHGGDTAVAGVIVPKSVVRRAVDRHRIRRQIYTILRPYIEKGLSVVVFVKKGAQTLPFARMEAEITGILGQQVQR